MYHKKKKVCYFPSLDLETKSKNSLKKLINFSVTVILNWIVFGLIVFGFAIVYNPLGTSEFRKSRPTETTLHKKGDDREIQKSMKLILNFTFIIQQCRKYGLNVSDGCFVALDVMNMVKRLSCKSQVF